MVHDMPPSTLCLHAWLSNLPITYWRTATSSLNYVYYVCRVRQQVIKDYIHVIYIYKYKYVRIHTERELTDTHHTCSSDYS